METITFVRRIVLEYELTYKTFAKEMRKRNPHFTEAHLKASWDALKNQDHLEEMLDDYEAWVKGTTATFVDWIGDLNGIDEEEHFEDNVAQLIDNCAEDNTHAHFVIKKETKTLVCPDGTEVVMERTADYGDIEFYAEWKGKDIGVFYYPEKEYSWVQGQTPTYNGEELKTATVKIE